MTPLVRRGDADDVPLLEPLWAAMHAHHAALPEVPPARPVDDSWARRRQQYAEWLDSGTGALLLAERDGELVGYAVVTVGEGPPTWDVGARTGEVESLAVLESERGGGVGRALMAAAHDAAREAGAEAVFVGVAHSNSDAIRFYAREGYEPFYVLMVRR